MDNNSIQSTITISIITGIISGTISSALFFYIMSKLSPKIEISNQICKAQDSEGIFYGFKILNSSRFDLVDIKLEFILKSPFNSNGGSNNKLSHLSLRKDHLTQFPKYRSDDKYAEYAVVAGTRDNIEEIWKESTQFLVVKVQAKHSLSGITKSFSHKYYTKKSCIKEGFFNFGKTFDIS